MNVSVLHLLYIAFQHCRHAPMVPEAQAAVAAILPLVRQAEATHQLAVDFPEQQLVLLWAAYRDLKRWDADRAMPDISAAGAALLSLNLLALEEASRLLEADAIHAVRSLGYAFHNLPGLVGMPEAFDPEDFMFCFRIMAADWVHYSPALQAGLCALMGLKLEDMPQLLGQQGFAIDMWG